VPLVVPVTDSESPRRTVLLVLPRPEAAGRRPLAVTGPGTPVSQPERKQNVKPELMRRSAAAANHATMAALAVRVTVESRV